jgi:hypothetical protein
MTETWTARIKAMMSVTGCAVNTAQWGEKVPNGMQTAAKLANRNPFWYRYLRVSGFPRPGL